MIRPGKPMEPLRPSAETTADCAGDRHIGGEPEDVWSDQLKIKTPCRCGCHGQQRMEN